MLIGGSLVQLALLLLLGLTACTFVGGWLLKRKASNLQAPSNLVEGTLFSILGLLLAFTLSGAAGRLETRRAASIDETNALGTASLRIELLPEAAQASLRKLYLEYTDNRERLNAELSGAKPDEPRPRPIADIQRDIWQASVAASRGENRILVIDSVNHLFDSSATREVRAKIFTPAPLFGFLIALSAVCAFFVGLSTAGLSAKLAWAFRFLFVFAVAAALTLVADLDNPRVGQIRMNAVDSMLEDTRKLLVKP